MIILDNNLRLYRLGAFLQEILQQQLRIQSPFHITFECAFCLHVINTLRTKNSNIIFIKQFIRQNTAQNIIHNVINDITVLLVLDFNKRVKDVKSTDVISVLWPNSIRSILSKTCRKHVFDIVCNMFSTSFRHVSNKSETCFRQKQKVCDKKCQKLVENVIDLSQHVEIDLSRFRQIFCRRGNGRRRPIGIQITMTFE